jgi:lysophospholipase L1-like esterase
VVYYGSSITQGGCASRPGNAYQAIISRETNVDHVNLGFSGSAKGEPAMAEYIKNLPMSVFVMDYDHNCNNAEHLRETHHTFYRIIREANPDLPIVIVGSSAILLKEKEFAARREVVIESYRQALAEGDKNVYFIDGRELFAGDCWDACTVDGTHPNDFGFFRMAMRIGKDVKDALAKTT